MTISPPVAPSGVQTPRICSYPAYIYSAGCEAVELAASAGLILDPWQQLVLKNALAEASDTGKWVAFEVGLVVSRQNGKGSILEARELAGLFLFDEPLIIHSAHLFDTSIEHFRRILSLIENSPDLDRRVARVSRSHGEEGIELRNGCRLRFKTRTKGGGRGFSGTTIVLDEAYDLPETAVAALMPTMSAQPNPQLWYTSSAVDQEQHDNGVVLARVRKRGIDGGDPSLVYMEWSADEQAYAADPAVVAVDVAAQAQANPGQGIRISAEHIAREQRSMGAKTFAVERLGVGDWPAVDEAAAFKIDPKLWASLIDRDSPLLDPLAFCVEVSHDRRSTSITAAGRRADGLLGAELVAHRPGTGWAVARLLELARKWRPCAVVLDPSGPAGSFIAELAPALAELGIPLVLVTGREFAQACGAVYDLCDNGEFRHYGQRELTDAIKGAKTRNVGDAWAWARKDSAENIAPLVGVTLALHGFELHGDRELVLEGALMA